MLMPPESNLKAKLPYCDAKIPLQNLSEPRMKIHTQVLAAVTSLLASTAIFAWSAPGHETVGAIADSLLVGTNAQKQVASILGSERLKTASLWADCAKGVTEKPPIRYAPT